MLRFSRTLHTGIVLVLLLTFVGATRPYIAGADQSTPQQKPLEASSPFGIAGAMRWSDWGSFSRPADAFMQTGAAWDREDFVWGLIQPAEGRFEWTATDRLVGALSERKANVLGIISYSANWATPAKEDDSQPSPVSFYQPDPAKYATFVKTLVSRYKGSVHAWEIWNEPDNSLFWKPAPDPKAYAELLKTAYRAVKEADPTAKVLTAGVSGNAVPFLEAVIAAGAGGSFDVLALHPYAVPLNPAQGRNESRPEVHKMVDVELAKYRALLDRHGYNRPVWITEIGWPAHAWGLDEAAQADYLAQAYAQMLASGLVERVFWYSFKDEASTGQDSWGLLGWGAGKTDLSQRRPAFNAYSTSARMLGGTKPGGRLQLASFTVVEDFEKSGIWTRSSNAEGTMQSEQLDVASAHGGRGAGKLDYNFTGPNQAVDFARDSPRPLPGKPTRLSLWARGNNSGNYLSAWLRDRDGELFKVRMGAVSGSSDGWRYYESPINTYYFDWEHALGSPANGRPDYPLQFVSFRLENTPDEPAGRGTVYLDDLQSYDGPDASAVRFTRTDGQVVDVLWSVDPTTVQLPTRSSTAQQTDRDGNASAVQASGGELPLRVSSSPIYIVHKPEDPPASNGSPPTLAPPQNNNPAATTTPRPFPQLPACIAQARTSALPDADNSFFAATGHNMHGTFKQYWSSHGAIAILGYPITEEFTAPSSDGKSYLQQYFQRARLEYHPENQPPNDVQVGLLGTWLTAGREFSPGVASGAGTFFPTTGHNIGQFNDWWSTNGGLGVFGYPISEEAQERNVGDGKLYTVQYFERNRLEYHPEYAGSDHAVLLGLLGVEYLARQNCK